MVSFTHPFASESFIGLTVNEVVEQAKKAIPAYAKRVLMRFSEEALDDLEDDNGNEWCEDRITEIINNERVEISATSLRNHLEALRNKQFGWIKAGVTVTKIETNSATTALTPARDVIYEYDESVYEMTDDVYVTLGPVFFDIPGSSVPPEHESRTPHRSPG